ncbi:MAG: sugar ABC transporter permease [Lawsonibacter sp.]|nr:sugar ABC transporter permease [Lawsonibacter sp.]
MSRALARRETISGYLFMLPSLLFFFIFVVYPMVMCVFTSLTDATMADAGGNFIGMTNYVNLFQDGIFRKALVNTVIIVVVSVPTVCAFSLWVGARIYKMKDWACSAYRVIFYLPVVTGSVAVTVVWKWIYHYYNGVLNYVGTGLGLWEMQVFWKVKWPQIMPTTLYILVITTINSFQCFALIQLLTSGGPNHATDTVMYYIYYSAFTLYKYGYANAMGVVLAICIALLSAVQFKLAKSE